jgi:hypothetical protein
MLEVISQIAADGEAGDLGWPRGVRREHPRKGAVTDEQQSGRSKDRPLRFSSRLFLLACLFRFSLIQTPLLVFVS